MSGIDPVSEALGGISADLKNIKAQNVVLFEKVDNLGNQINDLQQKGCVAGREACNAGKGSAMIWGSGAAAGIAAIFEGIRQITGK